MKVVASAGGARGSSAGKGQRGKFPEDYKPKSPLEKMSWLKGVACKRLVDTGILKQTQVEQQKTQLHQASVAVSKIVPAPGPLDAFEHGYAFPPRADTPAVAMRHARHVLHPDERPMFWPAAYLEHGSGATFDVVVDDTWRRQGRINRMRWRGEGGSTEAGGQGQSGTTASPTTQAMEKLEKFGARIVEKKLHTEDARVLQAQIDTYKATGVLPMGFR